MGRHDTLAAVNAPVVQSRLNEKSGDEPRFFVFYNDEKTGKSVPPEALASMTRSQVVAAMQRILDVEQEQNDTFLGITDDRGTTMQFAPQADGSVLLDIPVPEAESSYQARLDLDACCARVAVLDAEIDLSRYDDLTLEKWGLGLAPE